MNDDALISGDLRYGSHFATGGRRRGQTGDFSYRLAEVSICVLAVDPTTAHCGHRYYALSAACSLLKYAELKLNTRYAAGSLRIRYVAVEGTMMIDVGTVRNLELVNNISHKKSHHSLFGYEDPGSFTRSSSHLPPAYWIILIQPWLLGF
jgi:DNA mismatch repair ATPase MutS